MSRWDGRRPPNVTGAVRVGVRVIKAVASAPKASGGRSDKGGLCCLILVIPAAAPLVIAYALLADLST